MRKTIIFLIFFLLVIFQITIARRIILFGVSPNVPLAALLALILVKNKKLVLFLASGAGLALDFFSQLPFGLYALGFTLTIWLVRYAAKNIFRGSDILGQIVLAAAGALAYSVFGAVIIKIFQWLGKQSGVPITSYLIRVFGIELMLNFAAAIIFLIIIRRIHGLYTRI